MNKEDLNYLTLTEYILVKSKRTGRPYIGKDYTCYFFEVPSEAQKFADTLNKDGDKVELEKATYYTKNTFCTSFWSYGIEKIHVKTRNKDANIINISKEDTIKKFYNHDGCKHLYRLMDSGLKSEFRALAKETYYSPVIISRRIEKEHPSVHYMYAYIPNDTNKYFILFTTLQEFEKWKFEKWNENKKEDWKPLEINIRDFGRIRKGSPIVINPANDKQIFTDKDIKKMLSKK